MFGVMIALMLKVVVSERPVLAIKSTLFGMVMLTFGMSVALGYKPELAKEMGADNYIVIELIFGTLFACALLVPGKPFVYFCASLLFSLPLLDKIYDFSTPESGFDKQSSRIFILNNEAKEKIEKYFKARSSKEVIKVVDITPMWTAGTVSKLYADGGVETFPKVFPYFLLPSRITSYGGFTFYLSARADYMKRMPVVGEEVAVNPDWDYVRSTGADFLVAREVNFQDGPLARLWSHVKEEDKLRLPTGAIVVPIADYFNGVTGDQLFENGYFRLMEMSQIEDASEGLINLALGKEARESSDAGAPASLAVDGNTNGIFSQGSVSHTLRDTNAWMDIDLGASEQIDNVTVWNRTDCCGYCLNDFWLFISNRPFERTDTALILSKRPDTWGQQNFAPSTKGVIATHGQRGRYVRIQLPGAERTLKECFLSLAEVQVFGVRKEQGPAMYTDEIGKTSFKSIDFQSNDANRMRFEFENEKPTVLQYLFWSNPRLSFYLNGNKVEPVDRNGLPSINVPAGRNVIEVRYRHWPLTIFIAFYGLYALLIVWAVVSPYAKRSKATKVVTLK
jgi:hypothetical protein